ncbi:MAG: hypothetical protein N3G74_00720 [Candidatus Micrarchaeota archaeon]|nr:hypothetical protein [Candidatus Micrarchaeota archaeon]
MRFTKILPIVFMLLIPFINAQLQSEVGKQFQAVWQSSGFPWELLAIVAVFIGFSYSALSFMLSKLFSSSDLEKIAKYEFLYAISSLFLVVFMIFVIDILAVKSGQYVYLLSLNLGDSPFMQNLKAYAASSGYSPFVVAKFYLDSSAVIARMRYQEAFCAAFPLMAVSSLSKEKGADLSKVPDSKIKDMFSFLTSKGPLSQTAIAGIGLLITSLQKAMSNLAYLIYSIYFQQHLLSFIQSTMLTIFLPAGLVLRSFPFVRSIGNLLIAIAIGLYFVYPISYSLFIVISSQGNTQLGKVFISGEEANIPLTCVRTLVPDLIVSTTTTVFKMIQAPFTEKISVASVLNEQINRLITELIMLGFVFPFLAAVLTYTFIKSFGMVLNADIQEFAEGLVKLI